jgi:hypothetical protein
MYENLPNRGKYTDRGLSWEARISSRQAIIAMARWRADKEVNGRPEWHTAIAWETGYLKLTLEIVIEPVGGLS